MNVNADVEAIVDAVFKKQAYGDLAKRLLANNMSANALRTNDTLRKDEWKHYDTALLKVAQERLIGVADLMGRGLTYSIANGLGKTVLEYEDVSQIEPAQMSMDAVTRGRNDRVEFDIKYLPLPVIHSDFQINIRVLNASRTTGESLDTTMAELASRMVSEKMEELLFTGSSSYTFGGGTIFGYTDEPNRNTGSLTHNWNASAATGSTILADLLNMKQASIDARHYGPWMVYIPTAYETVLDDDFKTNSDKSIRQRVGEITGIADVKVADKLTANNVIMVQMTSDVVRWVEGLPMQTVEWQTEGGMIFHFKVMTIAVPQIRADQEGNSGLVHYS
jgi:hypothetical protein